MRLSLIVDNFDAASLHTFGIGHEECADNFHNCFSFNWLRNWHRTSNSLLLRR